MNRGRTLLEQNQRDESLADFEMLNGMGFMLAPYGVHPLTIAHHALLFVIEKYPELAHIYAPWLDLIPDELKSEKN